MTSFTIQMTRILTDALNLPPAELSALVGEILASGPHLVRDEAQEQLGCRRCDR